MKSSIKIAALALALAFAVTASTGALARDETNTGGELKVVSGGRYYDGPTFQTFNGGKITLVSWRFTQDPSSAPVRIRICKDGSTTNCFEKQGNSGSTTLFNGQNETARWVCSFRVLTGTQVVTIPLHWLTVSNDQP